ncbi:MAG: 3-hydroxyacyl-ACP dehydratase FabZ [Gammaproteobacteria bacterium]|jgi:3-hydroxyacyl-[acyl-carrier-protein] dehydratase|nr:3-hydroxyacyl-ACP dehydratase FabZ [Gammaproteobacteria bacterium]MBU0770538.1 3-hydroxyacyl-ACP dehydratase FabZ [Gammaproteobacteria bacterium]MBU0857495.1 3-hydroxyacyl-ACP dehydratase FabZ [Gammaproteobacteria bacterium]MBU1845213.1 3-hydroxyacyl-ACP dehydratase FabZ [Gammaproteobacteria bacterium]
MDIHEVLKSLPHRFPFLLVDRVLDVEANKYIRALKNVSINEPFFPGHFPNHPVMPGVLIVEALAQAAAILSFETLGTTPDKDSVYYLCGIDNTRFKKPVMAGDQLILEVDLIRNMRGIWKYAARAVVDGNVVAETELLCAVRPT